MVPTKSPIYDKKQRSKSNLEKGPKDEPKTGDAVVNKTTKKTSIVQACTEKFSANISASANKEYEDYRPVVALLEKCKTDEEEEVPKIFGDSLFKGYSFNPDDQPPEKVNPDPWTQVTWVDADTYAEPTKKHLVVDTRPRMIVFNQRISGGGSRHGAAKQTIEFASSHPNRENEETVQVSIERGGPETDKGAMWQAFDEVKREYRDRKESRGAGKWRKRAQVVKRACGCMRASSIKIAAIGNHPGDGLDYVGVPVGRKHNMKVLSVTGVQKLCAHGSSNANQGVEASIENAMDTLKEHCIAAGLNIAACDKSAESQNQNWIDAGSTPRWHPVSAEVRHRKDGQEDWSVHAESSGCFFTYSVAAHLEHDDTRGGGTFLRLTTEASSWFCLFDMMLRTRKFGSFVSNYTRALRSNGNGSSGDLEGGLRNGTGQGSERVSTALETADEIGTVVVLPDPQSPHTPFSTEDAAVANGASATATAEP